MPGYAKEILKRYKEGGKVEEYKSDLMKEVEGMGPEGKAYLKDKLQGKEYQGELRDEFKEELDKELDGMSEKGKEELKKLLGVEHKEEEKSIGELMAHSEEGYKDGGEAKDWIKGAVKKPGALRATAKREGIIKGDEKLSGSDLKKLAAQASKKDNKLLAKRVALAKTFAKMRK
jgi:hypothetical protein